MATVDGLEALQRKLAALAPAAKAEMRAALDEGADRLVDLARSLAPQEEGDLHASIRKEPGRHELAVEVRAGGPLTTKPVRDGITAPAVDYAAITEFGTPDHPAHPFLFPAWRAIRRSVRSRLARAYKVAAQRVGVGS